MAYGRLLNNMIIENGYNYVEFLKECEKRGKKIDKGNFSRIINDKAKPPKEDTSRLFASICNVDARPLVIEGYIDTAPKEIKEALLSLKMTMSMATLQIYDNRIDKENIERLKEELKKEPLSDFILKLLKIKPNENNYNDFNFEISDVKNGSLNITLEDSSLLTVKDNSMYPKIQKDSKIGLKLEEVYKNGDIIALKVKNIDDILIRYFLINNELITLVPLNNKFETITYKKEDILILGRVSRIVTEI